ncbi:GtrA family protein [Clostridium felsineum]|uniref:GtrA family protein n=1 Tax=Clostridium felsineum TaxID=36839 RepID=UPI00098C5C0B|nr:GtrA family protein [Clostridium felsineum]URZ00148.1 hypothetical protein CLAUR_001360 [Clostridium felsineum]
MKDAILCNLKKYYEFFKFCITGAMNTLISMLSYFILLKIGVYYILANVISYFIGMINSYILNRKWVFKSKDPLITTAFKFCCVNVVALGLSTLILYLFVTILRIDKFVAQLLTTTIIMLINYVSNKFFAFKKS